MKLNDYQRWTIKTAIYPDAGKGNYTELSYLGLGLASEAGEVAGKIKKLLRDGMFSKEEASKEVGDVFWYLCRICDSLGIDAETVLEQNYIKLMARKLNNTISGNGDAR